MAERIRIVVAESGPDGRDSNAELIARALRDAGMEVVYTGPRQTPEQIAQTAIQEDADAVGVSVNSGADLTSFTRIAELLIDNDAENVALFGSGLAPDAEIADRPARRAGKIFAQGVPMDEIVAWIGGNVGSGAEP